MVTYNQTMFYLINSDTIFVQRHFTQWRADDEEEVEGWNDL